MNKVHVIDYGMGNLKSVKNAFQYCGYQVEFINSSEQLNDAFHVVLPGVGAFGDAMAELKKFNLVEGIKKHYRLGKPLLGICLGMQLLFENSDEFGPHSGLGIIPGKVKLIPSENSSGCQNKVPFVGWSKLNIQNENIQEYDKLFLREHFHEQSFYFIHSFRAIPSNTSCIVASAQYNGHNIVAWVNSGEFWGCQFHPEKSADVGLEILKWFMTKGTKNT